MSAKLHTQMRFLLVKRTITLLGTSMVFVLLMSFSTNTLYAQDESPTSPPWPSDLSNRVDDIVGGEPAEPGEWPWQALIRFGPYICSGTLIHPEWILTAAHCALDSNDVVFEPSAVLVRLGEYDRSTADGTEQDMAVQAILVHPEYDANRHNNDVALIHLTTTAKLGNGVQIIHPLTNSLEIDTASSIVTATVTGWGRTAEGGTLAQQLMEVQVPIISNELCNFSYGIITENMLCAGYENGGYDACQGDSGGPLVLPSNENQWRLAGVVSFGFGCARPRFYGVYARVANFTEWLEEEIGPSLWETPEEITDPDPIPVDPIKDPLKGNEESTVRDALASVTAETTATLQIRESGLATVTITIAKESVLTTTLVELTVYTTTETVVGQKQLISRGFTLATSQQGNVNTVLHFQQPVTVSLYYTDSDIALLQEADLTLFGAATMDEEWSSKQIQLIEHRPENNQIIFTITQAGTYLLGTQQNLIFLPVIAN